MATASYVLGTTINFVVNFKDKDGVITNPSNAKLYLDFPIAAGARDQAEVVLSQDGDDWTYDWDSTVADIGKVYAHARTEDGPPYSTVEKQFNLIANTANPDLTS